MDHCVNKFPGLPGTVAIISGIDYPSSLSDKQWQLIQKFLSPANARGRKQIDMVQTVGDASLPRALPLHLVAIREYHPNTVEFPYAKYPVVRMLEERLLAPATHCFRYSWNALNGCRARGRRPGLHWILYNILEIYRRLKTVFADSDYGKGGFQRNSKSKMGSDCKRCYGQSTQKASKYYQNCGSSNVRLQVQSTSTSN